MAVQAIDIGAVFGKPLAPDPSHELTGIILYNKRHQQAMVHYTVLINQGADQWGLYNDSQVTMIGSMQKVYNMCRANADQGSWCQPHLLMYSAVAGRT